MELNDKTAIKSDLRKSFSEVVYIVNQLDESTYLRPRSEGNWSPGEILGHLILSSKAIGKGLSAPKMILKAQFGTSNREEYTKESLYQKYLKGLATQGIKSPSSMVYNGVAEHGKDLMLDKFKQELEKLVIQIDKWSEKDLSKYQLPHPAIGKLTMREMLFFAELHNYHHLNQIKEVMPIEVSKEE